MDTRSARADGGEKYLRGRYGEVRPVMLAKPGVQGLVWNQFADNQPHELAHGGLFDSAGGIKPIVRGLEQLRAQFVV